MQGPEKANGITFALMGSSGCGKSSVITESFYWSKYLGKLLVKLGKIRNILLKFLLSLLKSDAFKELPKVYFSGP